MRQLVIALVLAFAVALHVISLGKAADAKKMLPNDEDKAFVLPSSLLKIVTLEFRGLASDILFLDSMTFIGGAQNLKGTSQITENEWHWWTKTLETATDLDPYFFDPYYYANAFLPWDAHMAGEANRLLEKGSRNRDWDWMLPFFIGFNNFFFLQKDIEAADFLMEASRRPGGDPTLASIASRIVYKGNRIETAILFLEEIAKKTEDKELKKRYEKRIRALQSMLVLEGAVLTFKKKFNRNPITPDELVKKNIISQIPVDPYGGEFYITNDGKVRSTTSSELEPYISPFLKKVQQ